MSAGQIVGIVLAMLVLALLATPYVLGALAKPPAGVRVGDLWETEAGRYPGCYEVVEANNSTEAGPGSWVMRRVTDDQTLYMHASARNRGEWWLVLRDGYPTEMRHRRAQMRGASS